MPDLRVVSLMSSRLLGISTDLFLGSVGVPGVDDREDTGEDPGRSTQEEGGDFREAESTSKGRLWDFMVSGDNQKPPSLKLTKKALKDSPTT